MCSAYKATALYLRVGNNNIFQIMKNAVDDVLQQLIGTG